MTEDFKLQVELSNQGVGENDKINKLEESRKKKRRGGVRGEPRFSIYLYLESVYISLYLESVYVYLESEYISTPRISIYLYLYLESVYIST